MVVIDFLPDRLNNPPVVWKGFTTGEFLLAAIIGVISGIPLAERREKVALHITHQLAIDYEEKGHKVKYGFSLTGYSTSKDEMLPLGDSTMLELRNDEASTTHATSKSRATLRRPVTDSERAISQQTHDSYSRTQENEIQQLGWSLFH